MSLIPTTAVPFTGEDFPIDQSLRFNDDDSAYLSKTFASAGNRKTFTWSAWVKRGNTTTKNWLFGAGTDSSNEMHLYMKGDGTFQLLNK